MGFQSRTAQSSLLVKMVDEYLWNKLKDRILCCPYGYETHIFPEVQDLVKRYYTKTALHIRFAPDFLLVNLKADVGQEPVMLLEYKTITTPRYTLENEQWNYGQVEADAWDNYVNLYQAGIKVVIFIYCSYHSRPLLMDYPLFTSSLERKHVRKTEIGSGTDYYNFDMRKMRALHEFLQNELGIPFQEIKIYINNLMHAIINDPLLQTKHDPKSIYKSCKTGFNWQWL